MSRDLDALSGKVILLAAVFVVGVVFGFLAR